MNIFILDYDFDINAQYYVDKHVVKMPLEYAQLLSAAVRLSGFDAGYRLTHKNHPCTKWARESIDNFMWLKKLAEAVGKEYTYRYGRVHKSTIVARELPIPTDLPIKGLTKFAQAMPNQYKNEDVVTAYRNYYIGEKAHLFSWKKRDIPKWITKGS